MTTASITGWNFQVDRGPDWLFIRPQPTRGSEQHEVDLAENVYQILDEHMTHRLVLDMEEVQLLRSWMIGQLMLLHKRIAAHGGILRICSLNEGNQQAIHICQLQEQLPNYENRHAAVIGVCAKPR